ncbi:Small membrane A-kinase anchor protein [Sciurus carolinensis]|uniref:Small membrane A-kinase anchor protein n=1 Tax=Sciurus carolinensis TaxID=30640 RepID=A0AA41MYA8_SCICA|nr:small membrane A-kinase anchor protein [Sciurus carolinensis]MBZ3880285.1 Small membrane A-kinase anchor protein [Sciurus carolinensis]
MGCMKSKQTFPFPTTLAPEKQDESEETFMPEQEFLPRMSSVHVQEEVKKPPGPNMLVLQYAHRLSQEILHDAMQQWARNNIKYYDIPYIESDCEGLDAVG